jgi:ribosomal protein S18 acetylase RimI-like enzyme
MSITRVEAASDATPELHQALDRLIPQLSSSAPVATLADLERIVRSPATTLFVARTDDVISGVLTLVVFQVPTGVRALIEDVVVDERFRGQGIAELLAREALARAETAGARTVDLTSRPSREAANRLYQRLGFERRETNSYRYSL